MIDWASGLTICRLLLMFSLVVIGRSPTPEPTPPLVITRPVQIREKDRPLISTPGSRYTITIEGRVTDGESWMVIPDSTILVVTVTGSDEFWGGLFQISFPAEMVVNVKAQAPG